MITIHVLWTNIWIHVLNNIDNGTTYTTATTALRTSAELAENPPFSSFSF